MASDARTIHTTIAEYAEKEMPNYLRERMLLSRYEKAGRIGYNHSGDNHKWPVRMNQAPITPYGDGGLINFTPVDRNRFGTVEWKSYINSDSVTKIQGLKNRGRPAIVQYAKQMAERLTTDFRDGFCEKGWIDGESSANAMEIGGLLSPFQIGNGATALEGTCTVGDNTSTTKTDSRCVQIPVSTYAGLNCDLGAHAGSWSGNRWPLGRGDASYDFWTGLCINFGTGDWNGTAGGTVAVSVGLPSAIRFADQYMSRNAGKLDLVVMDYELLRLFKEGQDPATRVQRSGAGTGETYLGFESVWFDGVELTSEYGLPLNQLTTGASDTEHTDAIAFGLSLKHIKLLSMQSKLFGTNKDDDIATLSKEVLIDFHGQYEINPRHQCLFVSVGDS